MRCFTALTPSNFTVLISSTGREGGIAIFIYFFSDIIH